MRPGAREHSGDYYNIGSAVWPETQYDRHSGYCFDRSRLYHSKSFRDGRRIRDIRRREKAIMHAGGENKMEYFPLRFFERTISSVECVRARDK